ncbi:hypothetical protein MCOR27_011767, partial [Pyricularia oryzae]
TFRTTHCKPFHRDPAETQEPHDADERTPQDQPNPDPDAHDRPWTQADLDRALQKERLVVQLLQGEAYVTEKEKTAWDLAIALRAKGKINTPGPPFEAADDQEVDSLIAKAFSTLEEKMLHAAGFQAKEKQLLTHDNYLEFNGCKIQL